MLFLDNAAPDSCCAERPLHIPKHPRLVSTAATVREKTCGETTNPQTTNRPTDQSTTITLCCACAGGLKIELCKHHSVKTNLEQWVYINFYLPCGGEGILGTRVGSDMSAPPKHRSADCEEEMDTYTARFLYRTTERYNVTRLT